MGWLYGVPWKSPDLTDEAKEALEIIGKNVWKDASIQFYTMRDSKKKSGKSVPKGIRRYLNKMLDERFNEYGWYDDAGYYFKERIWIRVTFRYQMSLEGVLDIPLIIGELFPMTGSSTCKITE